MRGVDCKSFLDYEISAKETAAVSGAAKMCQTKVIGTPALFSSCNISLGHLRKARGYRGDISPFIKQQNGGHGRTINWA